MKLFPSFILIANWLQYLYHTKLDYNNIKHLFNTQEKSGSKKYMYTSSKLIFLNVDYRFIVFGYFIHQSKAFGTGGFNVQYTKRTCPVSVKSRTKNGRE